MVAHHQDFRLHRIFSKAASYFQPTHSRHTHVQQHHIGAKVARFLERFEASNGFGTNFPRGFSRQDLDYTAPYQLIDISNQYSHTLHLIRFFSHYNYPWADVSGGAFRFPSGWDWQY